MRVIFLTDVRGAGRKGDVKDVREGYARNFLIPRGLAKPGTPEALKQKEKEDALAKAASVERITQLRNKVIDLENTTLVFKRKFSGKGGFFGSVSKNDIETELAERDLEGVTVLLEKPIKTEGKHSVKIDFGEGVRGEITISLLPDEKI